MTEGIEIAKFDATAVITITDNESYIAGCELRKRAVRFIKAAHEKFDGDISDSHNHHKSLLAKLREIIDPAEIWKRKVDRQLLDYTTAQEEKRREDERRLQKIADKKEEERQLAEAIALEAQGETKEAAQVMAEPVYVPPVVVASTVPKVKGVSYPVTWHFRVTNAKLIPRTFLMPDDKMINGVVRAQKSLTNIPGIQAYSVKGTSGRAR